MVCRCLLLSAGWGLNLDGVNDSAIGRCFLCTSRRSSSSGEATVRRGSGVVVEEVGKETDDFEGEEKHDTTATRAASWRMVRMCNIDHLCI
jgi:hypothetical protein